MIWIDLFFSCFHGEGERGRSRSLSELTFFHHVTVKMSVIAAVNMSPFHAVSHHLIQISRGTISL